MIALSFLFEWRKIVEIKDIVEQELSPFDDEYWEECRRCEKTRKVKKVII